MNDEVCSICTGPIGIEPSGWDGGHNAEPLNAGRCCAYCNDNFVVPVRIRRVHVQEWRKDESRHQPVA